MVPHSTHHGTQTTHQIKRNIKEHKNLPRTSFLPSILFASYPSSQSIQNSAFVKNTDPTHIQNANPHLTHPHMGPSRRRHSSSCPPFLINHSKSNSPTRNPYPNVQSICAACPIPWRASSRQRSRQPTKQWSTQGFRSCGKL
jgi:hypothetical protein